MFKKTDPNPQLDMFAAPVMQLGSHVPVQFPHTQRQDQIQGLAQAPHPCL